MTFKRQFDAYDSAESDTPPRPHTSSTAAHPPHKRHRPASFPFSSSPSTATSSSLITPFSTPYTHTPPSDSPTNPFGRIRKLALTGQQLTLPRATSFSKHLPLRFQLVRDRVMDQGEGTYRIVQVPLNYTFRHLRKLLIFLFDDVPSTRGHASYTTRSIATTRIPRSGHEPGHLFEVQDSVRMYRPSPAANAKLGQIRSGHTWAKLSSVRDPFRTRPPGRVQGGDDHDEDGEQDQADEKEEDGEGEGEDDWVWEAEEDFTIGHVWPEGGDLKRACVYHHDSTTQIHITVNTTRIPGRKGVGNKPFVFSAFGIGLQDPEQSEDDGCERIDAGRWNGHEAFEKFLKRDGERESEGEEPDSLENTKPLKVDDDEDYPADVDVIQLRTSATSPLYGHTQPHLPQVLLAQTPVPQTKLHRLRVQYASRRMERLNKKGLGELSDEVGLTENGEEGDRLDGEEEEIC